MMGRSHLVIGATTTSLTLLLAGIDPTVEPLVFMGSVAVGSLAALLPDIDGDPDSPADPMIRSLLGVGNTQTKRDIWRSLVKLDVFGFLSALIRRVAALFINILARALPHRGVTHWFIVAAALTTLIFLTCFALGAPQAISLAFFVGYMSHILADMTTKSGVPFWGGLGSKKKYHIVPKKLRLRTGGPTETVVVMGYLAVSVCVGALLLI